MTPLEKDLSILAKDVAVIVTIQKTCQKSQAQTTANIDKLAEAVQTLSHDTVYLQTLETRLTSLEEGARWLRRLVASTVITISIAIGWYLINHSSK